MEFLTNSILTLLGFKIDDQEARNQIENSDCFLNFVKCYDCRTLYVSKLSKLIQSNDGDKEQKINEFVKDKKCKIYCMNDMYFLNDKLNTTVEKLLYVFKLENIVLDATNIESVISFFAQPNVVFDSINIAGKFKRHLSELQEFLDNSKRFNNKFANTIMTFDSTWIFRAPFNDKPFLDLVNLLVTYDLLENQIVIDFLECFCQYLKDDVRHRIERFGIGFSKIEKTKVYNSFVCILNLLTAVYNALKVSQANNIITEVKELEELKNRCKDLNRIFLSYAKITNRSRLLEINEFFHLSFSIFFRKSGALNIALFLENKKLWETCYSNFVLNDSFKHDLGFIEFLQDKNSALEMDSDFFKVIVQPEVRLQAVRGFVNKFISEKELNFQNVENKLTFSFCVSKVKQLLWSKQELGLLSAICELKEYRKDLNALLNSVEVEIMAEWRSMCYAVLDIHKETAEIGKIVEVCRLFSEFQHLLEVETKFLESCETEEALVVLNKLNDDRIHVFSIQNSILLLKAFCKQSALTGIVQVDKPCARYNLSDFDNTSMSLVAKKHIENLERYEAVAQVSKACYSVLEDLVYKDKHITKQEYEALFLNLTAQHQTCEKHAQIVERFRKFQLAKFHCFSLEKQFHQCSHVPHIVLKLEKKSGLIYFDETTTLHNFFVGEDERECMLGQPRSRGTILLSLQNRLETLQVAKKYVKEHFNLMPIRMFINQLNDSSEFRLSQIAIFDAIFNKLNSLPDSYKTDFFVLDFKQLLHTFYSWCLASKTLFINNLIEYSTKKMSYREQWLKDIRYSITKVNPTVYDLLDINECLFRVESEQVVMINEISFFSMLHNYSKKLHRLPEFMSLVDEIKNVVKAVREVHAIGSAGWESLISDSISDLQKDISVLKMDSNLIDSQIKQLEVFDLHNGLIQLKDRVHSWLNRILSLQRTCGTFKQVLISQKQEALSVDEIGKEVDFILLKANSLLKDIAKLETLEKELINAFKKPWLIWRGNLTSFYELLQSSTLSIDHEFVKSVFNMFYDNLIDAKRVLFGLSSSALQDIHWQEIYSLVFTSYSVKSGPFTFYYILKDLKRLSQPSILAIVSKIVNSATLQASFKIRILEADGLLRKVVYKIERNQELPILLKLIDIPAKVDDSLLFLQALKSSKFGEHFQLDIKNLVKTYSSIKASLDILQHLQIDLTRLSKYFTLQINGLESSHYQATSKLWYNFIEHVVKQNLELRVLSTEATYQKLKLLAENLCSTQLGLNNFVNKCRSEFNRFYFLSSDDVLSFLGLDCFTSTFILALKKILPGVESFVLNKDKNIAGVKTLCKGSLLFSVNIDSGNSLTVWLNEICQEIVKSCRAECFKVNSNIVQTKIVTEELNFDENMKAALSLQNAREGIEALRSHVQSRIEELARTASLSILNKAVLMLLIMKLQLIDNLLSTSELGCMLTSFTYFKSLKYKQKDTDILVDALGFSLPYQFELDSSIERLVFTDMTDRCFTNLLSAIKHNYFFNLVGPAGTGKTETIKAFGKSYGKLTLVFNCGEGFDAKIFCYIIIGLIQNEAFGCFDEFNRIKNSEISTISSVLQQITSAFSRDVSYIEMFSQRIEFKENSFQIFTTMNPASKEYQGRSKLPSSLKSIFRSMNVNLPDIKLICSTMLHSEGFKSYDICSTKLCGLFESLKELLSKQLQYDFSLRGLKSIVTFASRQIKEQEIPEETAIGNALFSLFFSRLQWKDRELFRDAMSLYFKTSDNVKKASLKQVIGEEYKSNKVDQQALYEMTNNLFVNFATKRGSFVLGPPSCGKTIVIDCLFKLLTCLDYIVEIVRFDPKSMQLDDLFGKVNVTTDGLELGILTKTLIDFTKTSYENEKLKIKNHYQVLVLDGEIDPIWVENLNSVLDENDTFTFPDGSAMKLPATIKILFETTSIENLSPATLSRVGIVNITTFLLMQKSEITSQVLPNGYLIQNYSSLFDVRDSNVQNSEGKVDFVSVLSEHLVNQFKSKLTQTDLIPSRYKHMALLIMSVEKHNSVVLNGISTFTGKTHIVRLLGNVRENFKIVNLYCSPQTKVKELILILKSVCRKEEMNTRTQQNYRVVLCIWHPENLFFDQYNSSQVLSFCRFLSEHSSFYDFETCQLKEIYNICILYVTNTLWRIPARIITKSILVTLPQLSVDEVITILSQELDWSELKISDIKNYLHEFVLRSKSQNLQFSLTAFCSFIRNQLNSIQEIKQYRNLYSSKIGIPVESKSLLAKSTTLKHAIFGTPSDENTIAFIYKISCLLKIKNPGLYFTNGLEKEIKLYLKIACEISNLACYDLESSFDNADDVRKISFHKIMSKLCLKQEKCVIILSEHCLFDSAALSQLFDLFIKFKFSKILGAEFVENLLQEMKARNTQSDMQSSVAEHLQFVVLVPSFTENQAANNDRIYIDKYNLLFKNFIKINQNEYISADTAFDNVWKCKKDNSFLKNESIYQYIKTNPDLLPEKSIKQIFMLMIKNFSSSIQLVMLSRFLSTYFDFFEVKITRLCRNERKYENGVLKIKEASTNVSLLNKLVVDSKKELELKQAASKQKLNSVTDAINDNKTFEIQLNERQEKLNVLEKQIRNKALDVTKRLEEYEPLLVAAKSNISGIDSKHLSEIRSMKSPPEPIYDVFGAVIALLGETDISWNGCKRFLSKPHVKDTILHFDSASISKKSLAVTKNIVATKGKSFDASTISRVSKAAAPFAEWVKANISYCEVLKTISPLLAEKEELKVKLTELNLEVTQCKKSLQVAIKKQKTQEILFKESTETVVKLELSLKKSESELERANNLRHSLKDEYEQWKKAVDSSAALLRQCWKFCAYATISCYKNIFPVKVATKISHDFSITDYLLLPKELFEISNSNMGGSENDTNFILCLKRTWSKTCIFVYDPANQFYNYIKAKEWKFVNYSSDRFSRDLGICLETSEKICILNCNEITPALLGLFRLDTINLDGNDFIQLNGISVSISNKLKILILLKDSDIYKNLPISVKYFSIYYSFEPTKKSLTSLYLKRALNVIAFDIESKFEKALEKKRIKLAEKETSEISLLKLLDTKSDMLQDSTLYDTLLETKKRGADIENVLKALNVILTEREEVKKTLRVITEIAVGIHWDLDRLKYIGYRIQSEQVLLIFSKVLQDIKGKSMSKDIETKDFRKKLLTQILKIFLHIAPRKLEPSILYIICYQSLESNSQKLFQRICKNSEADSILAELANVEKSVCSQITKAFKEGNNIFASCTSSILISVEAILFALAMFPSRRIDGLRFLSSFILDIPVDFAQPTLPETVISEFLISGKTIPLTDAWLIKTPLLCIVSENVSFGDDTKQYCTSLKLEYKEYWFTKQNWEEIKYIVVNTDSTTVVVLKNIEVEPELTQELHNLLQSKEIKVKLILLADDVNHIYKFLVRLCILIHLEGFLDFKKVFSDCKNLILNGSQSTQALIQKHNDMFEKITLLHSILCSRSSLAPHGFTQNLSMSASDLNFAKKIIVSLIPALHEIKNESTIEANFSCILQLLLYGNVLNTSIDRDIFCCLSLKVLGLKERSVFSKIDGLLKKNILCLPKNMSLVFQLKKSQQLATETRLLEKLKNVQIVFREYNECLSTDAHKIEESFIVDYNFSSLREKIEASLDFQPSCIVYRLLLSEIDICDKLVRLIVNNNISAIKDKLCNNKLLKELNSIWRNPLPLSIYKQRLFSTIKSKHEYLLDNSLKLKSMLDMKRFLMTIKFKLCTSQNIIPSQGYLMLDIEQPNDSIQSMCLSDLGLLGLKVENNRFVEVTHSDASTSRISEIYLSVNDQLPNRARIAIYDSADRTTLINMVYISFHNPQKLIIMNPCFFA